MAEYDYRFKVILLGDCGVGKTTFIRALSTKSDLIVGSCCCYSFTPNASTDLEFRRGDCKVSVKIIDTGGQERYRSMTHSYFRGADGCIIMYNTNNSITFENVTSWYETLENYTTNGQLPTIIAGTRSDYTIDPSVPEARAQKMAEFLEVPNVQIDLSNMTNMIGMLEQIVDLMINKYNVRESGTVDLSRRSVAGRQDDKKFQCSC